MHTFCQICIHLFVNLYTNWAQHLIFNQLQWKLRKNKNIAAQSDIKPVTPSLSEND